MDFEPSKGRNGVKFWRRWVGDYNAKTAGLSMIQHGAYTLLLDQCYASERPLPLDHAALYRLCRAATRAEREAIDAVLSGYFERMDDGYHNPRADEEITRDVDYRAAQTERSALGVAARTKPKRSNGKAAHEPFALPEWVPREEWDTWMEVRSKRRSPNTPRALGMALAELLDLRNAGHDPALVLRKACVAGWSSLYAPKPQDKPKADQGWHV